MMHRWFLRGLLQFLLKPSFIIWHDLFCARDAGAYHNCALDKGRWAQVAMVTQGPAFILPCKCLIVSIHISLFCFHSALCRPMLCRQGQPVLHRSLLLGAAANPIAPHLHPPFLFRHRSPGKHFGSEMTARGPGSFATPSCITMALAAHASCASGSCGACNMVA